MPVLVELIEKAATVKKKDRVAAKAVGGITNSRVTISTARHLIELERDNFNDVKIEVPKSSSTRKKSSANVRRVLQSKKNLGIVLEEAHHDADVYRNATSTPFLYPKRVYCTVCGYWGKYNCNKCGSKYCSIACRDAHEETRCVRF